MARTYTLQYLRLVRGWWEYFLMNIHQQKNILNLLIESYLNISMSVHYFVDIYNCDTQELSE